MADFVARQFEHAQDKLQEEQETSTTVDFIR